MICLIGAAAARGQFSIISYYFSKIKRKLHTGTTHAFLIDGKKFRINLNMAAEEMPIGATSCGGEAIACIVAIEVFTRWMMILPVIPA